MEIEVLCEVIAPRAPIAALEVLQGVSFLGSTGGGGGLVQVWNETPVGAINGTNQNFSTANSFRSATLAVYLNGLRQRPGWDYTVTMSNQFQMILAPIAGDSLSVDYTLP